MPRPVIPGITFLKAIEGCESQWMKMSGTSHSKDSPGQRLGPRARQSWSSRYRQAEQVLHSSEKSMVSSGKRTPNKVFPRRLQSSISSRTEQGKQATPTKNQITTRRSKQNLLSMQKTKTFFPR